jgi:hypothetical protein
MRYVYTITNGQAHDLHFVDDSYIPQAGEIVVNGDLLPDESTLHEPSYLLQLQLKQATDAMQEVMDAKAREYGYDNVHTASSYADSEDPVFKQEGQSFRKWREAVWVYARSVRDEVLAGSPPFTTIEQFLAAAPVFELIEEVSS